jgi:hypothetical protein
MTHVSRTPIADRLMAESLSLKQRSSCLGGAGLGLFWLLAILGVVLL